MSTPLWLKNPASSLSKIAFFKWSETAPYGTQICWRATRMFFCLYSWSRSSISAELLGFFFFKTLTSGRA